jgi:hypothetical protein
MNEICIIIDKVVYKAIDIKDLNKDCSECDLKPICCNKLYFPLDICMELGRRLGGTSVVFKKTEWNRN